MKSGLTKPGERPRAFISAYQERRFFAPKRTDDLRSDAKQWANKWVTVDGWHENVAMRDTHPESKAVGFIHEFCMDIPESELLMAEPTKLAPESAETPRQEMVTINKMREDALEISPTLPGSAETKAGPDPKTVCAECGSWFLNHNQQPPYECPFGFANFVAADPAASVSRCERFKWCVMPHGHKGGCSSTSYELVEREAETVSAKPEPPMSATDWLEAMKLPTLNHSRELGPGHWSTFTTPELLGAYVLYRDEYLAAQSISAKTQDGREQNLAKVLRSILQVGGDNFADLEMSCYCGEVMADDGDLDESAKCLVCLGWDALGTQNPAAAPQT